MGLGPWPDHPPEGLDTLLQGNNAGLSAGEAQLLAFTRVFPPDPGLVILYEASSRLDPLTERAYGACDRPTLQGANGSHRGSPSRHRPSRGQDHAPWSPVGSWSSTTGSRLPRTLTPDSPACCAPGWRRCWYERVGRHRQDHPALAAAIRTLPLLSWTTTGLLPSLPGLITRQVFDVLTGSAPAGTNLPTLLALLVGIAVARMAMPNWVGQAAWVPFHFETFGLLQMNMLEHILKPTGSRRATRHVG